MSRNSSGGALATSSFELSNRLEKALERLKTDINSYEKWTELRSCISPSPSWYRLMVQVEKQLTEVFEMVLTAPKIDDKCEEIGRETWQRLRHECGFRPKLARLVAVAKDVRRLEPIFFQELCQAVSAENSRKAFELICNDHALLGILLRRAKDDSLVQATLTKILFDSPGDIVLACSSPRAEKVSIEKRSSQHNWRTQFWTITRAMIPNVSTEHDELITLCKLFNEKNKLVVFWFELLFIIVESPHFGNKWPVLESLLLYGHICYQPTEKDDLDSLRIVVEQILCPLKVMGESLIRVTRALMSLDYRLVEPHLGTLVSEDACGQVPDNLLTMLQEILNSLLAVRRMDKFIEFVSQNVPPIVFPNKLDLYFSKSIKVAESLHSSLLDHQVPDVWKAFMSVSRLQWNEYLAMLLEAFIGQLNVTSEIVLSESPDKICHYLSLARDILTNDALLIHTKERDAGVRKKVKFEESALSTQNRITSSIVLSAMRLIRFSKVFFDLSGTPLRFPCEEMVASIDIAVSAMLQPQFSLDSILIKETFQLCLLVYESSGDQSASLLSKVQDILNRLSPRDMTEFLQCYTTRSLLQHHPNLNSIDESLCDRIWTALLGEGNGVHFENAILNHAFFYEDPIRAETFIRHFEASASDPLGSRIHSLLLMARDFPRGFLTYKQLKRMVKGLRSFAPSSAAAEEVAIVVDVLNGQIVAWLEPTQGRKLLKSFLKKEKGESMEAQIWNFITRHSMKEDVLNSMLFSLCLNGLLSFDEIKFILERLVGCLVSDSEHKSYGKPSDLSANRLLLLCRVVQMLCKEHRAKLSNDNVKCLGHILDAVSEIIKDWELDCSTRLSFEASRLASSYPNKLKKAEWTQLYDYFRQQDRSILLLHTDILISVSRALSWLPLSDDQFNDVTLVQLQCQDNSVTRVFFENISKDQLKKVVRFLLNEFWSHEGGSKTARNLQSLLESRLSPSARQTLAEFNRDIFCCLCRLLTVASISQELNDIFSALLAFFSNKRIRRGINSNDVAIMLTAVMDKYHPGLIVLLQFLLESQSDLLSDKCSGAFVRLVSACEREIIFRSDLALDVKERCALEFSRLCAAFQPLENEFKHLVLGIIADHITLAHFDGFPSDKIKRHLELAMFSVLNLCGDRELQQLHAVLGGGAGGARRDMLKRLVDDYKKKFAFRGKI